MEPSHSERARNQRRRSQASRFSSRVAERFSQLLSSDVTQASTRNRPIRLTHSAMDNRLLICRGVALVSVLSLQELDIDLGAVDADKFASTIGEAGGRQQQKELLEIEALDR